MRCALSDQTLEDFLREDAPYGDLTTHGLGLDDAVGRMSLAARGPMTVCGTEEVARLMALCGAVPYVMSGSGEHVQGGTELLSAQGPVSALLLVRQVSLTLIEMCSGLASEVARMVTALQAAGLKIPVACTREHFPGTRSMAVKAVQAGGGMMHALGLSDSLMLLPEHRLFVDVSLDDMVGRLRKQQPEKRLVVKVTTLQEALALAQSGADVLLLEGFNPKGVRECKVTLHESRLHPALAVSGGVDADNAVAYGNAGADILVTAAPYHAPPKEVEVRFSRGL